MRASETVLSLSPEETQSVGERLGARLRAGDIVACIGELGVGKTCFLQGLARGLGVEADVTSPSFVLVNQYRGRLPLYHVDAYRTESLTELVDLGLEEMLHGDGVTVIEWADKLLPLLPPTTITVTITGLGDEPRQIVIDPGPTGGEGEGDKLRRPKAASSFIGELGRTSAERGTGAAPLAALGAASLRDPVRPIPQSAAAHH